jgi:hypothetical protein
MDSSAYEKLTRRPRRLSVTISDSTYRELLQRSDDQGRSASNLAAFLLERGLQDYKARHGSQ